MLNVVVTFADFVEGGGTAAANNFGSAKRKMLDCIKKGVGIRERVTPDQLECLRNFSQLGLSPELVRAKSSASALFAAYLLAVHELQEHLLVVLTQLPENQPQFDNVAGTDLGNSGKKKISKRSQQLNDHYYGGQTNNRRAGTAASGGYRRAEPYDNIEMERKAAEESGDNPQELGINGQPKHQFYNEELEQRTKAIQDQFAELYAQLQVER